MFFVGVSRLKVGAFWWNILMGGDFSSIVYGLVRRVGSRRGWE
jgi:hypothetical protein